MNKNEVITEFYEDSSKYCLCIFVLNEYPRIKNQLYKLKEISKKINIIICDGGSTDGSNDVNFLKKFNVKTLISTNQKKMGLGIQMRTAFKYFIKKKYTGIITMDGNDKDNPNDYTKFTDLLIQGYDFIQGSRFIEGGSHQNTPLSRILGIKFIHAPLISLASSFKYTDTTNGFKGYSFRLIRDLLGKLESNHLDKYGMHIYLSIAANKFGYKCKEVGVIRQYPSNKKIPTKISFFKGNLNILFELIKIIILFRKI
ncbi:glycosyltransferase family 2 protein [Alphaproteobacteria bacterium]|nr:glycosyltransferase family 2 protein [Alphaproteobacteria bacterium]MDC3270498.1 glycosyltransferase family 2 protein [Alphaproteobacteria bacterium]